MLAVESLWLVALAGPAALLCVLCAWFECRSAQALYDEELAARRHRKLDGMKTCDDPTPIELSTLLKLLLTDANACVVSLSRASE